MDQGHFLFLDGKFIRTNTAIIKADNRSFRYGDGFFTTIKCENEKILLEPFHFERINQSIQLMQFQPPSYFQDDYFRGSIQALLRKNGHTNLARVRCTIYRGDRGIYEEQTHFPHLIIQSWPLNKTSNQLNINGLDIEIYPNAVKAVDSFSNIKSNNYLPYSMGAIWAKQHCLNDALLLNSFGRIADSTIANIFMVKNGEIFTPSLSEGPVAGVMRRAIISLAKQHQIRVFEQEILPTDLLTADEIFLTNAVAGLKWVKSFAGKQYPMEFAQLFFNKISYFHHE